MTDETQGRSLFFIRLGLCLNIVLISGTLLSFVGLFTFWARMFLGAGAFIFIGLSVKELFHARVPRQALVFFGLAVVIGLLYPPMGEYFRGNWDPNVYLNTASSLNQNGQWLMANEALEIIPEDELHTWYEIDRGKKIKYPGFYFSSDNPSVLEPQFYPFYSVLVSFGFQTDIWQYLNIILMLFSTILIGILAYQASGKSWLAATIASLSLLLSPIQIWFAGFPTAEVLLQVQFLLFALAWMLWFQKLSVKSAVTAGFLCACCLFTSVTAILFVGLCAIAQIIMSRNKNKGIWFFASWIILIPIYLWQVSEFTFTYFNSVFEFVPYVLKRVISVRWIWASLLVPSLIFFTRKKLISSVGQRSFMWLGLTSIFILTIYLFLFDYGESPLRPLILLCSRTGLLFSICGLLILSYKKHNLALMLVCIPVLLAAFFVFVPLMVQVFPWAYKRHLAFTLPTACLGLGLFWGYAASRLQLSRRGSILLCVLAILFLIRPLYRGREFAFERDWVGLEASLEQIDLELPEKSIVLTSKYWGASLDFHFGNLVLPIVPSEYLPPAQGAMLKDLLQKGHSVYVVRDNSELLPDALRTLPVKAVPVTTFELAQTQEPFGIEKKQRVFELILEKVTEIRLEEGME